MNVNPTDVAKKASPLESDEVGMRDLLDVLIMRTNHREKYVQQ